MNVYICTLKPLNSSDKKTDTLVGATDAVVARNLIRGTSNVEDKDILVILEPKLSYLGDKPGIIRKL